MGLGPSDASRSRLQARSGGRLRPSTGSPHRKTRSCSPTPVVEGSTSAASAAATGSPRRKPPGSSRYAPSTTCATPTPPSHWRSGLRGLPFHRLKHRDDRPALRPPRPRQPRTRRLAPRRTRSRAGRGRRVDVAPNTGNIDANARFSLSTSATSPHCGRSVDAAPRHPHPNRRRKERLSRNFLKPSDGLEPSTPSLPSDLSYKVRQQRLSARFPCKPTGSSARCTPSSESPESPRKASNLSPKPVPKKSVSLMCSPPSGGRRARSCSRGRRW
jgi:hypothetical protein